MYNNVISSLLVLQFIDGKLYLCFIMILFYPIRFNYVF